MTDPKSDKPRRIVGYQATKAKELDKEKRPRRHNRTTRHVGDKPGHTSHAELNTDRPARPFKPIGSARSEKEHGHRQQQHQQRVQTDMAQRQDKAQRPGDTPSLIVKTNPRANATGAPTIRPTTSTRREPKAKSTTTRCRSDKTSGIGARQRQTKSSGPPTNKARKPALRPHSHAKHEAKPSIAATRTTTTTESPTTDG